VIKVGEIKIVVSDVMEKRIAELSDKLGIKKTEYVKGLVIEDLRRVSK
jgi:predicted DNA-binding protein